MTNIFKIAKIMIIVLLTLIILGGGWIFLVKVHVLPAPVFLAKIPLIGSSFVDPDKVQETEEQKLQKENLILQISLEKRNQEINTLKKEMTAAQQKIKLGQENEDALKQEIAALNEQIIDLKAAHSNKEAVYKDMAQYFGEMKAGNAADIMSRLNDEDIIGILSAMESDAAAEVLQNMDREKAADVARKMLVTSN